MGRSLKRAARVRKPYNGLYPALPIAFTMFKYKVYTWKHVLYVAILTRFKSDKVWKYYCNLLDVANWMEMCCF